MMWDDRLKKIHVDLLPWSPHSHLGMFRLYLYTVSYESVKRRPY